MLWPFPWRLWNVRQGVRLLVKPGAFFNQLQWSSHHWVILILFLAVAAVETHVGKSQAIYHVFVESVQMKTGIPAQMATWVVIAAKLAATLLAAFVLVLFTWCVGNLFGRRTSKRVLFRRMSVVFTVFLAAYTLSQIPIAEKWAGYTVTGLYVWGLVLGYFALREQFALTHVEGVVLGVFVLLTLVMSFHFSNHFLERSARHELMDMARGAKVHKRAY